MQICCYTNSDWSLAVVAALVTQRCEPTTRQGLRRTYILNTEDSGS